MTLRLVHFRAVKFHAAGPDAVLALSFHPIPALSRPVREARGGVERLGAANVGCCLASFGSFQEPESDAAAPDWRAAGSDVA
jgi:hypothetical protein